MNARAGTIPNVTTADVTRGDFVDYIQIRGDIRPAKSIVLAAPLQAGGELQIVKLVEERRGGQEGGGRRRVRRDDAAASGCRSGSPS